MPTPRLQPPAAVAGPTGHRLYNKTLAGVSWAAARWFYIHKARPASRLRLVCFPYAGGGAHAYRAWPDYLPQEVEMHAVQMPGRGTRIKEPCHTSMTQLVEELYESTAGELESPFVFFGHSMGALVCFELARMLRAKGQPGPLHLFVSGRRAPQIPLTNRRLYELPDGELLSELEHLNGTPPEVLENSELMHLMLPCLRADFQAHGTYRYREEPALDCAITAFGGQNDPYVTEDHLKAWQAQTTGLFSHAVFPSDHFFLNDCRPLLLEQINRHLKPLLGSVSCG